MDKNYYWIIELIIVTAIFSFTIQGVVLIGADNFNYLFVGLVLSTIFNIGFLVFALFRLIKTSKKHNHTLNHYFKRKFLHKDILSVLTLVIVGPITYRLIMKMDFIHFLGISELHHRSCHLTSLQSWSMVSLILLLIPVGVLAEELYFRCYLFEIQYEHFRKYTWMINGLSWSIYHFFTPTNFVAFLPTCLIYSYVYQKRRNIWITIAAHMINNSLSYYPAIKAYLSQL